MPSVAERLFAACCRVCAACVALTPVVVIVLLVWASVTTMMESTAQTESGRWLGVIGATLSVSVASAVIGGALGAGAALAAEELVSAPVRRTIEGAIGFFGAIPAVAFGWAAVTVVAPFVASRPLDPVSPYAAAIAVLSVMIAPTACALVTRGLRRVPASVREASAAAGASKLQTAALVVMPAFRRRIGVAALAAFARAIGEATAMQMLFAALASRGIAVASTAAAAVFGGLTGGPPTADASNYVVALLLLCAAAAGALAVRRKAGEPRWA
jgi:ABC-type phosphate transport system permease subunit